MKNKARVKNINEYKKRKKNRYRKRKIKRLAKPILFSIPIFVIIIINLSGNAIMSNYKYEINTLKKELRKYNFLENKNTYIFLKKENNNKNNTINSSIIKNIFKKEKITTKLKIIK